MECTQRLQCTQELYETHTERVCPEQIGFLGILGTKHPVLRGPNKIGRDPQTCSIVLNLNSVSRQHAVINILNSREFMLMDLDSANKTKLLNKTLQPYIPHPLKNGDTVQFGDIFGVFRLLEEDDDLPMTQALDIPETPVPCKPVSKINKAPTTLIPESPDVSDRDDSFGTPIQTKGEKSKLSNSQFITPFGKTIPIQPVSSPKTDTSRNTSKKISFVSNPDTSLNESILTVNANKHVVDFHEMDTQPPSPILNDNKNIPDLHEMDTQAPNPIVNDSTDSIYTADTQIPPKSPPSTSIHSLNTQLPTTDHLPQVRKIDNQQDMQFDIYAANKENDISIFNAETQALGYVSSEKVKVSPNNKMNQKYNTTENLPTEDSKEKSNTSEEELLFDDIDGECFEEDFNSQKILPDELPFEEDAVEKISLEKPDPVPSKRNVRIQSDGSTDCEDIDLMPTQKVQTLPTNEKVQANANSNSKVAQRNVRIKSDSSTDCEDDDIMPTQIIPELPTKKSNAQDNEEDQMQNVKNPSKRNIRIQSDDSTDCEDIDIIPTQKIPEKKIIEDDDATDCEDDVIDSKPIKNLTNSKIEDMPTQIIDVDNCKIDKPAFEDMPTQIIDLDNSENNSDNVSFEDQPTQIIDEVTPSTSACGNKSFDDTKSPFKIPLQSPIRIKSKDIPKLTPRNKATVNKLDDNYYNATQDIYEDLCSQRELSPEILRCNGDDDVVPCSVEDYKTGDRFANIEKNLNDDKKVTDYVTSLSSQDVRDVIGGDTKVSKLKRVPSDSSDVEVTPRKIRPALFSDSDLPSSQEIKNNIVSHIRSTVTESSSESETENFSEELTPLVHRKKKIKPVAKIDLTKKFEVDKLPERVITRQRKPTSKLLNSTDFDKKLSTNMLRPTYLIEQEDQIDVDIITENIKRLKTFEKVKETKKESPPQKKTESKSKKEEIVKDVKTESLPGNKANSKSKNDEKIKEAKKESPPQKKTEPKVKKDEIIKEVKRESPRLKTIENKSKETKEKFKVKIERPKRQDTKSKRDSTSRRSDHDKDKSKDTSSSDTRTTRSTRGQKKERETKQSEKKSASPERRKKIEKENSKKDTDNKRKRTNNRREKSKSPEIEVRRSRRQQNAKDKPNEVTADVKPVDEPKAPKSILKKSIHEQSAVYNVSSCSTDSPKNLKRSMLDESDVPSPKRTRSVVNNTNNSINTNDVITNASLRATPARQLKTQRVLFTAFPSEEVKHKLEKLGAVIVSDVLDCGVVLTMQIKRTFKLLCAIGLGKPIVGPSWVQACVDTHMIVDPWLYLMKDDATEKRFRFNLERTLTGKRNFLNGFNVSSTPNTQPDASELKMIVECSGGTWKEGGPNWVCVSSNKDKEMWPGLRKRGATIVTTEFILSGVLRQKADVAACKFP